MNNSYEQVMSRKNEIMKKAVGIDYDLFKTSRISFDYEKMMNYVGYSLDEIINIQQSLKVGNTPLFELKNITDEIRKYTKKGYGARIFLKDEAANASGSFKARRAAISVYEAKKRGYKGVMAATSGNYGAAVASIAAMLNLKCIIAQETFDSNGVGQPEIVEKARKCEAFGAEVIQLTVGPELFYVFLKLLEETNYFNASLYTPFGIAGIESLGAEIKEQVNSLTGKDPDYVIVTHAGGGNLTGTARGLIKSGVKNTKIVATSVDLSGLHMASDHDFNKKSFTTGHTGFGIPFASYPDRSDVPRNAARPLRYMDEYTKVTQGQVFYTTELLALKEGIERGPAGNTSLAAAISIAKELKDDQIVVVQETEYTAAGKHPVAQINFAKQNGIDIVVSNDEMEIPGKNIVIPNSLNGFNKENIDLIKLKKSYIKNIFANDLGLRKKDIKKEDYEFISQEIRESEDFVREEVKNLDVK
jgi:cysteine synthase